MEQSLQVASTSVADGKAGKSSDSLMLIGSAISRVKTESSQSVKDDEAAGNVVPFIQMLNQQLSLKNQSAGDATSDNNGKKIAGQEATLLLQGDITLAELQQQLTASVAGQSESATDEKDENNSGLELTSATELQQNLAASLQALDALAAELAVNPTPDLSSAVTSGTDLPVIAGDYGKNITAIEGRGQKSPAVNENEQIISKQSFILVQAPEATSTDKQDTLSWTGDSAGQAQSNIAATDWKNSEGEITAENLTELSETAEKEVVPTEAKDKILEKAAQSTANAAQIALSSAAQNAPVTVTAQYQQASGSVAAAVKSNLTDVQAGSKVSVNNVSAEAEKEESDTGSTSGLFQQEMKDALTSKENSRSMSQQSAKNSAQNTGSTLQADSMQSFLSEISGKAKAEQKMKTVAGESRNEDISLAAGNVVSSSSTSAAKTGEVSADTIIGQISGEIRDAAANDGGRIKITLNPPSLGKLEMDVTLRNGKVEVVLVADNKDVQSALNTNIDKLKGSLQNQGLTIERCDVFMQDKRDDSQQNLSQQAFYQERQSRQETNSSQDNVDEEIKSSNVITERPASIWKSATDNISLFA